MDLWIQETFIGQLNQRLEGFNRKSSSLYNFRCPFCGDSKKNKHKARGYLYREQNDYKFHCHNCGISKKLINFVKDIDPSLFWEMRKAELKAQGKPVKEVIAAPKKAVDGHFKGLTPLDSLGPKHLAQKYINSRKIPKTKWPELYYCPDYRAYVNSFLPDKLTSDKHAAPRIVIPFMSRNNVMFGFQGRALNPDDEIRYLSIIIDEAHPKAYNLNNVNFNKPYYILEGPFDSMFIPNSIAACGSDVLSVLNQIGCNKENGVIVFDNEPRNPQIMNNIAKAIDCGWGVCIWPDYWPHKDINDAIIAGETVAMVQMEIDNHTYHGMRAKLALANWRKDDSETNFPHRS